MQLLLLTAKIITFFCMDQTRCWQHIWICLFMNLMDSTQPATDGNGSPLKIRRVIIPPRWPSADWLALKTFENITKIFRMKFSHDVQASLFYNFRDCTLLWKAKVSYTSWNSNTGLPDLKVWTNGLSLLSNWQLSPYSQRRRFRSLHGSLRRCYRNSNNISFSIILLVPIWCHVLDVFVTTLEFTTQIEIKRLLGFNV